MAVVDDVNERYAKAMAMTISETESIGVTGTHRKAYESSLPEILGPPQDEIQAVNTHVLMAVGKVRVTCGRIQGLRGEVVAKLSRLKHSASSCPGALRFKTRPSRN